MAGLVPAIHALTCGTKNVDARAFASPKRLRPRRRDKPGLDEECVSWRRQLRCQLTRFQVWPPQNMPPKAQPCTRIAFGPFIAIVES
ncbi:hypothetical protein ABIF20_005785 [Bradyrhizobium japonicum]